MEIPSRPMAYLYTSDSDSDVDSDVKLVRVPYEGSHPRRSTGHPSVWGSRADISIKLFKTVTVARMKKRSLKPVDKTSP